MSALPSLALAGIGLMGLPMCRRLLAAGFTLTVCNRPPDESAPLAAQSARVAARPTELCEADLVMLCLADSAAVRTVVFGSEGIVAQAHPGQLLVDAASADPAATREMEAEL